MDIVVGKEQVFCLIPRLNINQARECAWDKKTNVFPSGVTGLLNRSKQEEVQEKAWNKKTNVFAGGVTGLLNRSAEILNRPRPEDIKITDSICRYEPFWHVTSNVRYVYDRTRDYNVPINEQEVKYVTIDEKDYPLMSNARQFTITVIEHCIEEASADVIYDGVSGQENKWKRYLSFDRELVKDLSTFSVEGSIVVSPEITASNVVRKVLDPLFKSIKSMTIFEQKAVVDKVDLYFRPVYAFEYEWVTTGRTAVAEFDGLTGEMILGGVSLSQHVQKAMTRDLIFDLSQEAANLLVPGGGIAVRVIKEFAKDTAK